MLHSLAESIGRGISRARLASAQRAKFHGKRLLSVVLLLLLGCYLAGPFVAGTFRIGERDGPAIYPQELHTALYNLAYEGSHDGEKPRQSLESMLYNRPFFYGMAPRLKPAVEREALLASFRERDGPPFELLFQANQKAEMKLAD